MTLPRGESTNVHRASGERRLAVPEVVAALLQVTDVGETGRLDLPASVVGRRSVDHFAEMATRPRNGRRGCACVLRQRCAADKDGAEDRRSPSRRTHPPSHEILRFVTTRIARAAG
jgi:hypothetical protein